MNHITRVSTKGMSKALWKACRKGGIGGSDEPILLGMSNYSSPLELHLDKIGEYTPFDEPNRFSNFGKLHEPEIANLYQYWDGDINEMFENKDKKRKINSVRSVYAFIHNAKYPHMFASIDRMILASKTKPTGVLECKNVEHYKLKRFKDDIPYEHIVQLVHYLIVTELEYGVIALEVSGNNFLQFEFHRDDEIVKEITELILKYSIPFWENVVKAREIKKKAGITTYYDIHPSRLEDPKIEKAVAELQALEPKATPDESLEKFLNKIFVPKPISVPGTREMMELAIKHEQFKSKEKEAKKEKTACSNQIKSLMKDAEEVDFDEAGKIHWKADKKGTRRLNININA